MEQDAALQLLRDSLLMARTHSVAPLLDVISSTTLTWSGAADGYLVWLDEDGGESAPRFFFARGGSRHGSAEFSPVAMQGFQLAQPIPAIFTPANDEFEILGFKASGSVLWAPFSRTGSLRGGLVLADPQLSENENQFAMLGLLVEHAGVALQNALLTERTARQIQYLSDFDHLVTKLPNRALFKRRAADAWRLASAAQPLGLLFLDLDDFGRVNQTMGHSMGDKLLFEVANRFTQTLSLYGSETFTGRLGGDEFGVLLYPTSDRRRIIEAAGALVEKFREPLVLPCYQQQITISVGVALGPLAEAQAFDELLVQAERAMYVVKSRGGNSFEIFILLTGPVAQRDATDNN